MKKNKAGLGKITNLSKKCDELNISIWRKINTTIENLKNNHTD